MMRGVLRLAILLPVALSALAILVQAIDGVNPLASEGVTACLVLWSPSALALVAWAYATATRRIWRWLKWLGLPVLSWRIIQEEEYHGIMDLD